MLSNDTKIAMAREFIAAQSNWLHLVCDPEYRKAGGAELEAAIATVARQVEEAKQFLEKYSCQHSS
jgi:hypothetical protein